MTDKDRMMIHTLANVEERLEILFHENRINDLNALFEEWIEHFWEDDDPIEVLTMPNLIS
jgi:hypothetical protein